VGFLVLESLFMPYPVYASYYFSANSYNDGVSLQSNGWRTSDNQSSPNLKKDNMLGGFVYESAPSVSLYSLPTSFTYNQNYTLVFTVKNASTTMPGSNYLGIAGSKIVGSYPSFNSPCLIKVTSYNAAYFEMTLIGQTDYVIRYNPHSKFNNTDYNIQLNINNSTGQCSASLISSSYSTSTPQISFDSSYISGGYNTNTDQFIRTQFYSYPSSNIYFILKEINQLSYQTTPYLIATSSLPSCLTCTRVVSETPGSGDVLTSNQSGVYASVYLSSLDNANLANTFVRQTFFSIKAQGSYDGTDLVQIVEQPLVIEDQEWQTFPYVIDFSSATGTWLGKTQILERIYTGSWWNPFDNDEYTEKILASSQTYRFHLFSETSLLEEQNLIEQYRTNQETLISNDVCLNEGTLSLACFMVYVNPLLHDIKYAPPQGYAFLLLDKLIATTTGTSTIGMLVSFPEGSPLRGHTLNLDTSAALSNSLVKLQNEDIETLPYGAVDTFMKYWNYLCYILFGLWIIKEIFGGISTNFEYNPNAGNYKKSGTLNVHSAHRGGRLTGNGKSVNIQSYD